MPVEPHASPWILAIEVANDVGLPTGDVVDRETFSGWLWAEWGDAGLLGVDEGSMDTAEAADLGLVAAARVIDAAAAPADRDWVAGRETAAIACWFADEATAQAAAERLVGLHGVRVTGIGPAAFETAADWRSGFERIEIPGFGAIVPAWEPGNARHDAGGTTIFIEPGAGFGTGSHETTRLCLAALAAWRRAGRSLARVLDFGSGSGILGIAAAVMGAGHVAAVEVDPRVHDAIRGNAARNGVADCVRVAERLADGAEGYDLVCANIVAAVLLEHAETICGRVRRPGGVVLSGLLAAEIAGVTERYAALLGAAPVVAADGEWHCLVFAAAAG
jgi:ribosomal protein L11 methyltransferase